MSQANVFKIYFTRDTLERLRDLKKENPAMLKAEACQAFGVGINTMNKAADRAGLRKELTELFPPRTPNVARRKKRQVQPDDGQFPINWNCPHIKAATMKWR